MIILIDAEKVIWQNSTIILKILNKLRVEENFFNPIKGHPWKKSTANKALTGKRLPAVISGKAKVHQCLPPLSWRP